MKGDSQRGQLLLEVLISISAAAVVVALGAQMVYVSLQSNKTSGEKNVGLGLVEETFEAVRNVATERWQSIFTDLSENTNYYPEKPAGKWIIHTPPPNTENVTINTLTYTRSFTVQNVCRNSAGAITGITDTNGETTLCAGSGGTHDPSTQKINVTVSWPNADALTSSEYITRWRNDVCVQTSWSTQGSTGVHSCNPPDTTYDTSTNLNTGASLTIQ